MDDLVGAWCFFDGRTRSPGTARGGGAREGHARGGSLGAARGRSAPGAEAQAQAAPFTDQRPNILLIISDDVGTEVTTGMFPGLIE